MTVSRLEPETPSIVVPDAVAPFRFGDLSDAVDKQVKTLHKLGVHTIVVLAHAGGFQDPGTDPAGEILTETAQMDPDVDLVVDVDIGRVRLRHEDEGTQRIDLRQIEHQRGPLGRPGRDERAEVDQALRDDAGERCVNTLEGL